MMISPGVLISERYEIIDKVGSGGMADVYKAKCHRLNRFVAIKVLKQEYSNDAKFVAKFRAEAQSVAGLSHPNVVNVYDVGEDEGLYYIVMELIEGITLKKFIEKKGKLEVNEAVGIAIQIAQAMEAAHDNHIIHRDIKPQNIIISKEGKVKVTDFGIAKAATSNTITSNAMGSVHYISPEQARGGYSDEKSDIYSLGVTMYEMLSGGVPFEGDSTVTVALAHIQEDATALNELDPQIPRSLSRVVQKCMQKKPEFRYLTAAALIADLKRVTVEPDGDYVILGAAVVNSSPTIPLSGEDLKTIKGAARVVVDKPQEEELPGEEETEIDEDAIDPKLERILKVCSAVVAVIVIVGAILLFGKFAGWFDSGKEDPDATASPSAVSEEGKVEVPDIVGSTLEEAEKLLQDANLNWQLQPVDSKAPANEVTDQEPAAGEMVDEYYRVTIYYSQNDDGATIPDVVNNTEAEARKKIEEAGLVVGEIKEEYSSTVEAKKVVGTDPVVGSSVDKGTTVNLIISKGTEGDQVVVPNIVGKKEAVALKILTDSGLQGDTNSVTYVHSDKYARGRVVSQSYKSGQKVDRGTVIEYSVSLGPEATEPPATKAPTVAPTSYEASLTVSTNPFEYPEEDPATITLVLSQNGYEDKQVWKGTLSYSDFPKAFPVEGSAEGSATVVLYKNGQAIGEPYTVILEAVQ